MDKRVPEHFHLDNSVLQNMFHLIGMVGQVAANSENFLLDSRDPTELKLHLAQICFVAEQVGEFINVVNKWCGELPPDLLDMIPTWVLLDAEDHSRR